MHLHKKEKTILFITPNLFRSGSEMLLVNLIKGINQSGIRSYVYSLEDGELAQQLPQNVTHYLPYNKKKNRKEKFLRSFLKRFKINPFEYQLRQIQKEIKADLWYINTIVVDPIFFKIGKELGVRIVTHFHELPGAYRLISQSHLQLIIRESTYCIGCSKIVCDKIRELGHRNVKLFHSFIDTDLIDKQLSTLGTTRQDLGILPDEFVWVISGRASFEKGVDCLLPLLEHFQDEKMRILWLGEMSDDGYHYYLQSVLAKYGSCKLTFTGALRENYYHYMSLADGLLMPSKEDSFSLVMLEAAYLGLPIVSFNSGGVAEFVSERRGIVVDSWNAKDLARAMVSVMEKGRLPKERDREMPYTVHKQVCRFMNLVAEMTELP